MFSRPHLSRVPSGVVDLLRLFVVVFFAALGSLVGSQWDFTDTPFDSLEGPWIGVVVGFGLGYVLGGVIGRSTVAAVDRTEQALRGVSAETIVGGLFGGLLGVFVSAAVSLSMDLRFFPSWASSTSTSFPIACRFFSFWRSIFWSSSL